MTPEQVALVQSSFRKVAADPARFGRLFYIRLFQIHPDIQPLFPDEMASQQQKFLETVTIIVAALDRFDVIRPELRALGVWHYHHGSEAKHYDWVGEALVWALSQTLKRDFTLEVRLAWNAAYKTMAETMLVGVEEFAVQSS